MLATSIEFNLPRNEKKNWILFCLSHLFHTHFDRFIYFSCWWWIWKKFCAPRELRSRTIHIGKRCEEKYPKNEIRNQVSVLDILYTNSVRLTFVAWSKQGNALFCCCYFWIPILQHNNKFTSQASGIEWTFSFNNKSTLTISVRHSKQCSFELIARYLLAFSIYRNTI